jgi:putative oligomerization/nucleic acid binding protein
VLGFLDTSIGGGAVVLDALSLVLVLAILVGVARIARLLTAWRIERRSGSKRKTGKAERLDTVRRLSELRDSGALSEEEFLAAKTRVSEE